MHARRLRRAAGRLAARVGLAAAALLALLAGCAELVAEAQSPPWGNARRGLQVMHQYACSSCHVIPGVTGGEVHVGPPLAGMARRGTIAGELPNTPPNMVRWLRNPQAVDPRTAMPDLELTEQDAIDAAAYLATLH